MKKVIKIILAVMGCLILLLAVLILSLVFMTVNHMKKQVNSFDRTRIEISQVQDGVYEGKSETDLVKVEVRVTVSNGEITNIPLTRVIRSIKTAACPSKRS